MNRQCNPDAIKPRSEPAPSNVSGGGPTPQKKKPKQGFQLPTVILPPVAPAPIEPAGGWASALMKRLAEWAAASGRAVLGGIGVFILAMLSPLDAGVSNEWEQKLPEEDENRYRELEAKRSAAIAKGQKLPLQEESEWQALEDRKYPHGRGGESSSKRKKGNHTYDYEEVEIVNQGGEVIGEFDGIDTENKVFIEDKSAEGLNKVNPRTGKPSQTPEEWAARQILKKTNVRIANLEKATGTRPTKGGSAEVPGIDEIKDYRKIHFEIDSTDPEVKEAVADAIDKLKEQHPDWDFSVNFGK